MALNKGSRENASNGEDVPIWRKRSGNATMTEPNEWKKKKSQGLSFEEGRGWRQRESGGSEISALTRKICTEKGIMRIKHVNVSVAENRSTQTKRLGRSSSRKPKRILKRKLTKKPTEKGGDENGGEIVKRSVKYGQGLKRLQKSRERFFRRKK